MAKAIRSMAVLLALVVGCIPVSDEGLDNEVISRVELTFTPIGGGDSRTFAFSDPDGDGGVSGVAEPIELEAGVEYTLELRFLNDLADPPRDISEEVRAEAEDHLVFVLGDVRGPASASATPLLDHEYADLESDYGANLIGEDLPVGMINMISTISTISPSSAGTLRIVLRHLPELNGQPQKTGDLPQRLAQGEDLPGNADVDVSFELTVL